MTDGPQGDPASLLHHVTDDLTPRQECRRWLIEELRAGREPDELVAELVSNGWAGGEAEGLVEKARQSMHGNRGALGARNQVAMAADSARQTPTVLHVPDHGGAFLASVVLGIAKGIQWAIGRESHGVRERVKAGLCYKCGNDVKNCGYQCPACGSPVIRRKL